MRRNKSPPGQGLAGLPGAGVGGGRRRTMKSCDTDSEATDGCGGQMLAADCEVVRNQWCVGVRDRATLVLRRVGFHRRTPPPVCPSPNLY